MGNAVTKKFDVPRDHSATAGHCGLFKIWPGKKKETGEEVSVWAFDKADLLKRKQPVADKTAQEQIFQLMRKDFTALKDCSCGGLISVIEVIEENKNAIVFTTERIICSLADVMSRFETVPSGAAHADFFENGRVVSEIEVSRGFLNLAEGLQYLHVVQRKLHLGINPESVVITAEGIWKLCSLGLSLGFQQGDQLRLPSPYFLKAEPAAHASSIRLEPDLRYSGPELTAGGFNPPGIRYLTPSSDVFSLGVLAYEVYRFNLQTSGHHSPIIGVTNNAVNYHIAALDALSILDFSFLQPNLVTLLRNMLCLDFASRPDAGDVANNSYFVTGALATMRMIDTLGSRDVGTQSSQLIALPNHLSAFPPRVLQGTILPVIFKLCTQNPSLWVYALATHMYMAQHLSGGTYTKLASSYVAQGLAVTTPVEVMQIFLKNITWLVSTFDGSFVEQHVTTLYCNALDKQNSNIQAKAFEILADEQVRKGLSKAALHDKLVPRACKEACKNSDANVKIYALYFLSLVVGRLDREFIIKNILPSLKFITDNEKNPIVSMCVIGNYEVLCDIVGPEYIASSILPTIQPMLIDRSLNKQQFALVVNLSRIMLKKVVDMRTSEMGMPEINFTVEPSEQGLDAFASAKAMIAASKQSQNDGTGAGAASVQPPPVTPLDPASLFTNASSASTSSGTTNSSYTSPPMPVSTPAAKTAQMGPISTPTMTPSYPTPSATTPASAASLSPPAAAQSIGAFKLSPPPPAPPSSSTLSPISSLPPPPPPPAVPKAAPTAESALSSFPSQQRGSSLRSVKGADKGLKRQTSDTINGTATASSNKSNSSAGSTDILGDFNFLSAAPAVPAPTVPLMSTPTQSVGGYSGYTQTSSQWPSSSMGGGIPSPSNSNKGGAADVDDFLASFGQAASISAPTVGSASMQYGQSSQFNSPAPNVSMGSMMSASSYGGVQANSMPLQQQQQYNTGNSMGMVSQFSTPTNSGVGNAGVSAYNSSSGPAYIGSNPYAAQQTQIPNPQQSMYTQPQQQQFGYQQQQYQQHQQQQPYQQQQQYQQQSPSYGYQPNATMTGGQSAGQPQYVQQMGMSSMGYQQPQGGFPGNPAGNPGMSSMSAMSMQGSVGTPTSYNTSGTAGGARGAPPSDHDPFAFLH